MTKSTSGTSSPVLRTGLTGDLHGRDDARAPLVLLHGLSFDRRTWQPVLDAVEQIDPGRRALVLDLPGHGDSPPRPPHTTRHISEVVHAAVEQAGLHSPVVVGYSVAGGIATVYASTFPVRGVVNVDASPTDLPFFAAMFKQLEPKIRGGDFDAVWSQLKAGGPRRRRARRSGRAIPAGIGKRAITCAHALSPRDRYECRVEVWADSGHFAHLAHLKRFAAALAETGGWSDRATS